MDDPTSVHTQETNDLQPFPPSFREFSNRFHHAESLASEEMYAQLDQSGGTRRLDQFLCCRTKAFFTVNQETLDVRIATNNCRLRWCPVCSGSLAKFRSFSIRRWLRDHADSRFVTFTLRHSDAPLTHQINWIYYYFRQLRKTRWFRSIARGGVWFFQVTLNRESNQWHPHLHVLLDSPFIPHSKLSEVWKRITRGSFVVDIRSIFNAEKTADYVSRYASRPCQLKKFSLSERTEIFSSFHGRRLCGKWGTAQSCLLSPQRKTDLSGWIKIGSYRSIVESAPFNDYCKIILQAWKTGSPLPSVINMSYLDKLPFEFDANDLPSIMNYELNEEPPPWQSEK